MSDEAGTHSHGRRHPLALRNLYLDPNNFRIVDHPEYRHVPPEQEFDAAVQRRTTSFVLGRNQEQVRDLIASIKENGWLDIDPLLIQRRGRGRYLVIEGNRRVATLKYLHRRYEEDSIDLGKLSPAVFSSVPTVLYEDADERHYMVMMGLHHISGKRRWPAINRALAMKRLLEHFHGDPDAVCRALGVTKREFNLSIRTLALVNIYKKSDYGDQFRSEQYNLFREILKSPSMRKWLGWDETTSTIRNELNLDRLFLWMSRDSDSEGGAGKQNESQTSEPVITTAAQVRELARVIDDPKAVRRLEETRSLQEATLSSDLLAKSEVDRTLKAIDQGIHKLGRRIGDLDSDDLDRVDQFIGQFQGLSLAHKRRPPVIDSRSLWKPFNEITSTQFSSVSVERYRGIDGLALDNLGRVNMIVGVNNAGKTSLLESVYLLARQNDDRGLLDVLGWRERTEGDPEPHWIVDQLPMVIKISGSFDKIDSNTATFIAARFDDPGDDIHDHTSFLGQVVIRASYGGHDPNTVVHFFGDRARRTHFSGRNWLCRAVFTSPFATSRSRLLERSHRESLEAGTKKRIIDFIREHIDPALINIEMADSRRFLVSHKDFDKPPDLSSFGEGVRRVFEIGLLCAGARGGVLLVDEFENAIHTELLGQFTHLIHKLARELNVQLFLTTHSKEAIDAWLLNNCETDDIVGYALGRAEDRVTVQRYGGEQLRRLHDAVDFDLRGVR